MNLNTVVEVMARKARELGFVAGVALLLAVHPPSATIAQDGIDRVTDFARDPVHVAAWPAGRKVAVSFALFVEEFGFAGTDVLALENFKWAFIAMAAVSVSAVAAFLRLPADAGSELTRRSGKAVEAILPAAQ